MLFDIMSCYWKSLCKIASVKYPVHFFRWNIFYSLSYEQIFLTDRIAGKLMNIKKIKIQLLYFYFNIYNFYSSKK